MGIEIRGIPGNPTLRNHVVEKLEAMLEGHGFRPTTTDVGFSDENGPKGGVAIRCLVEVRLARRPPLAVHHVAETAVLAFEGSLEKLDRQLGRDRARRRARSRRPKKYYAAKRLLTEGLAGPASEREAG